MPSYRLAPKKTLFLKQKKNNQIIKIEIMFSFRRTLP